MANFIYQPPQDPWLDICYQDDDILIANKPAKLLSVPGREPIHYDSLWSRLVEQYPDIQVVHRLDMATSGLMLLAKHKEAERSLKKQFQYRLTHKVYYARVYGHIKEDQGEIHFPLICDWVNRPRQKVCYQDGKPSQTNFEVVCREEGNTTLVRLLPVTGRSHQLRVHMEQIGYPILGDEFYATPEALALSERLQLHAAELSFYHPNTEKLFTYFIECEFAPQLTAIFPERLQGIEQTLPSYK